MKSDVGKFYKKICRKVSIFIYWYKLKTWDKWIRFSKLAPCEGQYSTSWCSTLCSHLFCVQAATSNLYSTTTCTLAFRLKNNMSPPSRISNGWSQVTKLAMPRPISSYTYFLIIFPQVLRKLPVKKWMRAGIIHKITAALLGCCATGNRITNVDIRHDVTWHDIKMYVKIYSKQRYSLLYCVVTNQHGEVTV